MSTGEDDAAPAPAAPERRLTDAARRALAEAEARRQTGEAPAAASGTAPPGTIHPETGGRRGPEPVRYGDWEVKGIASDF